MLVLDIVQTVCGNGVVKPCPNECCLGVLGLGVVWAYVERSGTEEYARKKAARHFNEYRLLDFYRCLAARVGGALASSSIRMYK